MTSTAEHLSKTAADTLCKKSQQMKHVEEQFLENCRTCVHDKPVTPLIIDVALGRQDAGRDKVAGFRTGKPMRLQRPQTKPEPQAKTPTPLKEAPNLLTLAQNITSAWPWIPMMRAGRPAPAARFVPHCSPVMGLQPITGEWPRPMPGGKASCL
ncbi:hypothetical protein GO003_019375 [Methylicorpusculum oleiharenae]|uniref:hypothetical protein n=1 Tax=Methylicorpusculum oleiharenae TaxID=1338687 RepID=UPI00135B5DEB|nr:hypothetical protein [Methylicorpusculum oleiharenae]MCD2452550.1 hypothetical protein [Methylicorpusculum oleiharenae]